MFKVRCTTSEQENSDFVGLKFDEGLPQVVFPRGYAISESDDELRKDIIHLFSLMLKYKDNLSGNEENAFVGEQYLSFPLFSYQYIIQDFLRHGYYMEKEVRFATSTKGKVCWKRTIQQMRPQIDGHNAIYLDFVARNNIVNTNFITKIHEYCVYESFKNLGWLYTSSMPSKPAIPCDKKKFISVLSTELRNTNNDAKKKLFSCMINVINSSDELFNSTSKRAFGVERFEYIWEWLVDYVFGDSNKELFFPHSTWDIITPNSTIKINPPLEPDTIISHNGNIFVIDAKYYKYGITFNPDHLPGTTSIQKQVTYAEYIEKQFNTQKIYNAFVMPFDKKNETLNYKFVSVGTADWKENVEKNYEFVLGILLDTRHVINTYSRHNLSEIEILSSMIIDSLTQYKESKKHK